MVRTQSSVVFREAACALLRLSRSRGRAECEHLAEVFEEDLSDERRILILDLLASAGTPEAQLVMRRLLSLPLARKNSRTFATFVQRLGFIEQPETATVQFLLGVYEESHYETNEVRAACAYALGSAAGRAHAWGLVASTVRAAEVLRRDLARTHEPGQKCSLLTALGKAGLDRDVQVILSFFGDLDARVRNAAALALRNMLSAEVRANLISMLTGNDPAIAEAALSALFGQSLPEGEIIRIAELVLKGRTNPALDARLLRLVVTQKLETLMTPGVVAEAIHLLLARIEGQSARGSGEHARVSPPAKPPTPTPSPDRSGEYLRTPEPIAAVRIAEAARAPISALAVTNPPTNRIPTPPPPAPVVASVPTPPPPAPMAAVVPQPVINAGSYSVVAKDAGDPLDATVFEKRSPVAEVLDQVKKRNASPAARTVMQDKPSPKPAVAGKAATPKEASAPTASSGPAVMASLARTLFQGSFGDDNAPAATVPLAPPARPSENANPNANANTTEKEAQAEPPAPPTSLKSQSAFSICMPKSPLARRS